MVTSYCAARVLLDAHADLPDGAVLAEDVVHVLGADLVGQIAHEENAVHLRGETDLNSTECAAMHIDIFRKHANTRQLQHQMEKQD